MSAAPTAWRRRVLIGAALLAAVPLHFNASAGMSGMIRVPAGQTRIGADRGSADEQPSFLADVAAFDLDRAPVTVAEFANFVSEKKYRSEAERLGSASVMSYGSGEWKLVAGADWRRPLGPKSDPAPADHPVTQVSWNDAVAYCAAQDKRLPSEIEYEYAARLGGGAHAFGTRLVEQGRYRANVWTGVFPMINTGKDGYKETSPVGAFGANALGFVDLAGNVWEWTLDWYRPYAQRQQAAPAAGEKVQRGGSFLCDPNTCYGFRVSARGHAAPDSAHMHVGFRCARDA